MTPYFIVGHPRSGTTLLAAILGRHSLINSTPESHYFNKHHYLITEYGSNDSTKIIKSVRKTRINEWPVDWDKLKIQIDNERSITPSSFFKALINQYQKKPGSHFIVEKTPVHIRHIPEIIRLYPSTKIIWILRDGRATIASLKKVNWATNNLDILSKQWNRNMAYAIRAREQFPSHIQIIKYESLMESPIESLSQLHEFLDIPFEEQQLKAESNNALISKGEDSWKGNINKEFMPSRSTAWKSELNNSERDLLTKKMFHYLNQFGYLENSSLIKPITSSQKLMLRRQDNPCILFFLKSAYHLKQLTDLKLKGKLSN